MQITSSNLINFLLEYEDDWHHEPGVRRTDPAWPEFVQNFTSLQLCGNVITDEQKIEKTLSTFHPNAVQSIRNYRQDGYKEYAELINIMQVTEAQDDVLRNN